MTDQRDQPFEGWVAESADEPLTAFAPDTDVDALIKDVADLQEPIGGVVDQMQERALQQHLRELDLQARAEAAWGGYEGRECGEHLAYGWRAWCPADSEWCYEDVPCRGCEIPLLRKAATEAEARIAELEKWIAEEARAIEVAPDSPMVRLAARVKEGEALLAEAVEMLGLLNDGPEDTCAICAEYRPNHKPECALDAFLATRKVEG